jgi:dimethylglycine dehydrogenase
VRVAYTGELGWELHHPVEMQTWLWDRLIEAGEPSGHEASSARARRTGCGRKRATAPSARNSGRDATPMEAGLERFVDMEKDFHGKARMVATGVRSRCVTVLVDGPDDADPWGREGLFAERTARSGG